MIEQKNFPLIDLFIELRDVGLQLNIRDYADLIKALQAGFGISTKEALLDLCKTLWAKNNSEAILIQICFYKYFNSKKKFRELSHQVSVLKYHNNIPFLRSNSATFMKISSNRKKFIPLIEKRENHSKILFWTAVRLLYIFLSLISLIFLISIDTIRVLESKERIIYIYITLSPLIILFTFLVESIFKTRLVDTEDFSAQKPALNKVYLIEKLLKKLVNKVFNNLSRLILILIQYSKKVFGLLNIVFISHIRSLSRVKENKTISKVLLILTSILLVSVILSFISSLLTYSLWIILAMILSTNVLSQMFGGSQKFVRRASKQEKTSRKVTENKSNHSSSNNRNKDEKSCQQSESLSQESNSFEEEKYFLGPSYSSLDTSINKDISEFNQKIKNTDNSLGSWSSSSSRRTPSLYFNQDNSLAANQEIPKTQKAKYLLQINPFPIKKRQIQQTWRALRQTSNSDRKDKFDIKSTIKKIAAEGFFLEEVMTYSKKNQIEIIFFIDFGGSMTAFNELSTLLVSLANDSGRFSKTSVYYFHNCPSQYVYTDRYYQNEKPIDKLVNSLTSFGNKLVAVIISDAGSARGSLNEDRIYETEIFVESLKRKINKIVWLNPLPEGRWTDTSAEVLSKIVPMFDITPQGLSSAVSTLRGRTSSRKSMRNQW